MRSLIYCGKCGDFAENFLIIFNVGIHGSGKNIVYRNGKISSVPFVKSVFIINELSVFYILCLVASRKAESIKIKPKLFLQNCSNLHCAGNGNISFRAKSVPFKHKIIITCGKIKHTISVIVSPYFSVNILCGNGSTCMGVCSVGKGNRKGSCGLRIFICFDFCVEIIRKNRRRSTVNSDKRSICDIIFFFCGSFDIGRFKCIIRHCSHKLFKSFAGLAVLFFAETIIFHLRRRIIEFVIAVFITAFEIAGNSVDRCYPVIFDSNKLMTACHKGLTNGLFFGVVNIFRRNNKISAGFSNKNESIFLCRKDTHRHNTDDHQNRKHKTEKSFSKIFFHFRSSS